MGRAFAEESAPRPCWIGEPSRRSSGDVALGLRRAARRPTSGSSEGLSLRAQSELKWSPRVSEQTEFP